MDSEDDNEIIMHVRVIISDKRTLDIYSNQAQQVKKVE